MLIKYLYKFRRKSRFKWLRKEGYYVLFPTVGRGNGEGGGGGNMKPCPPLHSPYIICYLRTCCARMKENRRLRRKEFVIALYISLKSKTK